jgi:hypothetical protein
MSVSFTLTLSFIFFMKETIETLNAKRYTRTQQPATILN